MSLDHTPPARFADAKENRRPATDNRLVGNLTMGETIFLEAHALAKLASVLLETAKAHTWMRKESSPNDLYQDQRAAEQDAY